MRTPYTYDDLQTAYRWLGVGQGKVIYVTSDLGRLMNFEKPGKLHVLDAHFSALMSLIGESGTLVVPTSSINLCNTDIPFDVFETPSFMVGALSEYVRKKTDARRSFHPFVSYTAVGAKADEITQNVSRYSYGINTPMARMIELDTLSVSIGLHPRFTCSTAHHVEQMMAVPYRYIKEFAHPVVRNGAINVEPFYMYCLYRNSDIARNFLKWIFPIFETDHALNKMRLGASEVYSYRMKDFVDSTCRAFLNDPYVWCERPPAKRPWRQ